MLNKKGNLLPEETLKIVIAVICIAFLVFLLVSVYFSVTGAQDTKYAEASLKKAIIELVRINLGGNFSGEGVQVPNPSGWYVMGFTGQDKKPNSCAGENCICICETILVNIFDWQKRQIQKCDDKGICEAVSNLKAFDKIKIENDGTTFVLVKKVNGNIEISRK